MTDAAPDFNVQRFIDEERFSPYQWLILALCFLNIAIDFYDALAVGFSAPSLIQEWDITMATLGPVISASALGLMIGAWLSGPLADITSPKKVIVGSILAYGAFTFISISSSSTATLALWRFLTGLGLGASGPMTVMLMYDYAPRRKSALLVNTMYVGGALGAVACGWIAAAIIPSHGWRSLFVIGGALPIMLAITMVILLPESLRFMVAHRWPATRIEASLRRINPDVQLGHVHFVLSEVPIPQKMGSSIVLSPQFRYGTIMLWIAHFSGLIVFYLLLGWLPTILHNSGFTASRASQITTLLMLGGVVGLFVIGRLMDFFEKNKVLAAMCVLASLSVWLMGSRQDHIVWLGVSTFITGLCGWGAVTSMPILANTFYPTLARPTGVAWMYGFGRIGGAVGPTVGGFLLQAKLPMTTLFGLLAVPLLIAALALIIKWVGDSRRDGPGIVALVGSSRS
jgi:AAHS family 4-hydroxybenzoate transporter-like MFS transporter